jgi:hypothetical protein
MMQGGHGLVVARGKATALHLWGYAAPGNYHESEFRLSRIFARTTDRGGLNGRIP